MKSDAKGLVVLDYHHILRLTLGTLIMIMLSSGHTLVFLILVLSIIYHA